MLSNSADNTAYAVEPQFLLQLTSQGSLVALLSGLGRILGQSRPTFAKLFRHDVRRSPPNFTQNRRPLHLSKILAVDGIVLVLFR